MPRSKGNINIDKEIKTTSISSYQTCTRLTRKLGLYMLYLLPNLSMWTHGRTGSSQNRASLHGCNAVVMFKQCFPRMSCSKNLQVFKLTDSSPSCEQLLCAFIRQMCKHLPYILLFYFIF